MPVRRNNTQQDQPPVFQPGFGVSEDDPIYLGVKANLEFIHQGKPLEGEDDFEEQDDDDEDLDV